MNNKPKQGRPAVYDDAFKLAVVHEYYNGNLGYGLLGRKHGIDLSTVRSFVQWHKKHFPDQQPTLTGGVNQPFPAQAATTSDQSITPREKELMKALEYANMKVVALETMISIAKTELGVDLSKKSGAKQSGK